MSDPDAALHLIRFGYMRTAKAGEWLKYAGFAMFRYSESTGEWSSWFRNARGELVLVERVACESRVDALAALEAAANIARGAGAACRSTRDASIEQ